ncbi:hypothetical protein [Rodentibacter trehalosifermentans]|uniref:Uncharacterized protein n=1 Tax=Rodentibacter trehalosifermentans TaxID=1908263 RepID=A0A1V3IV09_9PAST|nr:hypothetical protein [Rodentibacter trehalosifermentans]OOF45739.1 hypothetical protein BKK51_05360 [Rodentibacter trehalosifermentans]OOF49322.1 hypothetical protein BKK52_03835 [Rodentibacter trehalosifermentans]OOF51363.1 hypothetical protein BKK53_07425 [Rodentibacter trehalosifermentans]
MMRLSKCFHLLFLLILSSFAFAGHYPAKVNKEINLYYDAPDFKKTVIVVKKGTWLNTKPMLFTTEIGYGLRSLHIAEQDLTALSDKKPLELEQGIPFGEIKNTFPIKEVRITKDTWLYNKSVLTQPNAENLNSETPFLLKATDVPCEVFQEVSDKSGKTFYAIFFNDQIFYILKDDTSLIQNFR